MSYRRRRLRRSRRLFLSLSWASANAKAKPNGSNAPKAPTIRPRPGPGFLHAFTTDTLLTVLHYKFPCTVSNPMEQPPPSNCVSNHPWPIERRASRVHYLITCGHAAHASPAHLPASHIHTPYHCLHPHL